MRLSQHGEPWGSHHAGFSETIDGDDLYGDDFRTVEADKMMMSPRSYLRWLKMSVLANSFTLLGCVLAFEAQAADGGINSALAEAGCIQLSIKTLPPIGKALVYEATCAGTSHTIVRVVCMDGKCVPDHPHGRRDEPDELNE